MGGRLLFYACPGTEGQGGKHTAAFIFTIYLLWYITYRTDGARGDVFDT